MATPQVVETSESHNYKTWVLKVSIHCACAGCIKKVKNKLLRVAGVQTVDVDAKQHKVTVTGDVEAKSLLLKLNKHGRHAALWLDQKEKEKEKEKQHSAKGNKSKSPPSAKDIEKPNLESPQNIQPSDGKAEEPAKGTQGNTGTEAQGSKPETGSAVNKTSPTPERDNGVAGGEKKKGQNGHLETDKITQGSAGSSTEAAKIIEGDGKSTDSTKEPETNGKKPETGLAGNQSPQTTTEKKMKKKGQNRHVNDGQEPSSGGNYTGPTPRSGLSNHSPPRGYGPEYPPPPQYYAQPPVVSYNITRPSTTSYFASPPPQSYAHLHPGHETQALPLDFDSSYARQTLDSFELISDENPNGCSII